MRQWRRSVASLLVSLAALAPARAAGQGLTGAAVEARVRDSAGRPVSAALIELLHLSAGTRWTPAVSTTGRFVVEHVSGGGPYRLTVRAIGFQPLVVDSLQLATGQRLRLDLTLAASTTTLDELRVTAPAKAFGPGRAGPERQLDHAEVERLPNIQRNLINLGAPGPHVLRFEFNGWNSQLTSYSVDGGQGSDLYSGGHTGRGVFGAPVPLEAIEEVRLLSAPYDVRYGQVTSGQFALTTRRATDRWTGSAYGTFQNEQLVNGAPSTLPFTAWTTGLAMAGPLLRDRLQLSVAGEYSQSVIVDQGPFVTDTAGNADYEQTGVQWESAERFARILADRWGLDAGTLGSSDARRPRLDLWAKLTGQLGAGGELELSQRVASGDDEGAITRRSGLPYRTGSTTRFDSRDIAETRLAWRTLPRGRWANELVAGLRFLRERCRPAGDFPRLVAAADSGALAAGADSTCGTTDIRQTTVELSEHATVTAGKHVLTGGAHLEWFSVEDSTRLGSQGSWRFASLDALEAGMASQYERTVPGPFSGTAASAFDVWSLGWYVQDRLQINDRVQVVAGLRVDRPVVPDGGTVNADVESALGLTTGQPPETRLLWSPRASASWDVTGRGTTWVRGGAGIFSGRPPYRWLSGIYTGSGGERSLLSCRGTDTPPFDPIHQPDQCGSGARPIGQKNVYDGSLRFPQIAQASLGVDHQLPGGLAFTGDLVAGWGISQFRYTDANLQDPIGRAAGEGGRPMYGTIAATGTATPTRLDPSLGPVVLIDRGRGDRTLSASAGIQRSVRAGWGFEVNYRWNDARDYQSLESSDPLLNLGGTPLEGTHAARALGRSLYHSRHRVYGQITIGLPWQGLLSLIHVAANGTPYSYVVDGDANGDGLGQAATGHNDLIYVPTAVHAGGDIRLVSADGSAAPAADYAALDSLIAGESCLQSRRGQLATRNGCTNPWIHFTNARVEAGVPTRRGQRITLAVDVFNLPNLLNSDWGRVYQVSGLPAYPILTLRGWDSAGERGSYSLRRRPARAPAEQSSRWRLQFTARYRF
jgi:hypothetical protein